MYSYRYIYIYIIYIYTIDNNLVGAIYTNLAILWRPTFFLNGDISHYTSNNQLGSQLDLRMVTMELDDMPHISVKISWLEKSYMLVYQLCTAGDVWRSHVFQAND